MPVNAFLTSLAVDGHVSAATQNQALSAILFLYRDVLQDPLPWITDIVRARRSEHVPVVLTPGEARAAIEEVEGTSRLVVPLLYGSGLRLMECLQLRVKDIDFARHELFIRDPKGRRDRVTTLPHSVETELRAHLERTRRTHDADLRLGFGSVALPTAIDRKFPNADREWLWQWVFPATSRYVDKATGMEHRHHLQESAVLSSRVLPLEFILHHSIVLADPFTQASNEHTNYAAIFRREQPLDLIRSNSLKQRLDSRITKSPSGEAALRRASSLSKLGTASSRSYRAYEFREDAPSREATSRSDAPLASRRRRNRSAVIAAALFPATSNSYFPVG